MRVVMGVVTCVVFGVALSASLAQEVVRATGFFSDLAYDQESGDLWGLEIFISYARVRNGRDINSQHFAYVQVAQGVPDAPQLVPVNVEGSEISFELGGKYAGIGPFSGTVTADSLIGSFSNGSQVRLARRASYWQ